MEVVYILWFHKKHFLLHFLFSFVLFHSLKRFFRLLLSNGEIKYFHFHLQVCWPFIFRPSVLIMQDAEIRERKVYIPPIWPNIAEDYKASWHQDSCLWCTDCRTLYVSSLPSSFSVLLFVCFGFFFSYIFHPNSSSPCYI